MFTDIFQGNKDIADLQYAGDTYYSQTPNLTTALGPCLYI